MRILLAKDDKEPCEAIKLQLEKVEHKADCCGSGQEVFCYATEFPHDVALLGRILPQMDGFSVLNGLRRMGVATPVIITTTLDGINDRIDGLDAGMDDYLAKPYVPGELFARIHVVTRRPGKLELTCAKVYPNTSLDPEKRELTGPSGMVQLNKRESALMGYPIHNAGQILTRGAILPYIWGSDSEVEEGNLDSYAYFLRRRPKSVNRAVQIKAIYGTGYRLETGSNP